MGYLSPVKNIVFSEKNGDLFWFCFGRRSASLPAGKLEGSRESGIPPILRGQDLRGVDQSGLRGVRAD
jgi:hypothetical protein